MTIELTLLQTLSPIHKRLTLTLVSVTYGRHMTASVLSVLWLIPIPGHIYGTCNTHLNELKS